MLEISSGAIVYTLINDKIHYLLIKDFHNNYGFPKGHVESGETTIDAAKREIKEEVGLDVNLDTSFHETLEYIMPNSHNKIVHYYIGSYNSQNPTMQEEEVKELLLLPYNKAIDILTFDNMKEVLKKANHYLLYENE